MRTILILAIFAIGISLSVRVEGQEAKKVKKVNVKNETTFTVPEKYQKMMGLKTAKLSKDGKGSILVPDASIQSIKGKSAIMLSLGKNKFALRYIEVNGKSNKYSLVKKNVLENELVVTNGAAKLKAGVLRMMSNKHKGHAHGAGGHSH